MPNNARRRHCRREGCPSHITRSPLATAAAADKLHLIPIQSSLVGVTRTLSQASFHFFTHIINFIVFFVLLYSFRNASEHNYRWLLEEQQHQHETSPLPNEGSLLGYFTGRLFGSSSERGKFSLLGVDALCIPESTWTNFYKVPYGPIFDCEDIGYPGFYHGHIDMTWCICLPYCFGHEADSSSACSSHGCCMGPDDCSCDSGWTGAECETPICYGKDATNPSVCGTHGTCSSVDTCTCDAGWAGIECQSPVCHGISSTNPSVCSSHGTCTSPGNCACDSGWTGSDCGTPICYSILATDPSVCSSHGTCSSTDNCVCDAGYMESQCQTHMCNSLPFYDSNSCGGLGSCVDVNDCDCDTGAYLSSGTCLICPIHHACDNNAINDCRSAPTFPLNNEEGNSFCMTCPAGHYVTIDPSETYFSCDKCPLGFSCSGDGEKEGCPPPFYADATGLSTCKTCSVGSYLDNNVCIPCRAQYEFCPNGRDRIVCQEGDYFDSDLSQCLNCPHDDAYYCTNGKKHPCPEGHYIASLYDSLDSTCLECSVGHHCPGDGKRYTCIDQYYSDLVKQMSCKECSAGYFTDNSTTSCIKCDENEHCPNGIHRIQCSEGTYLSGVDCVDCEEGFFCVNGLRNPCPSGYFSNETRSTQCTACPSGRYFSLTRASSESDCVKCPLGKYAPDPASTQCLDCAEGSFSDSEGLSSCTFCPNGTYQAKGGQSSCTPCPAGSHSSSEGSTECVPCPAGSYSPQEGYPSCLPCAAGSFSDGEGSTSCTLCAPGSYNENTGSSSSSDCIQCSYGGSVEYGANSSSVCSQCLVGQYLSLLDSQCLPCVSGTYSNSTVATECTPCVEGTFSNIVAANSSSTCRPCRVGTYSDQEGQSECTPCPSGTYFDLSIYSIPGTSKNVCVPCPAGFSSFERSTECFACPSGTFAAQDGSPSCDACPLGSFSNSSSSVFCTQCSPGFYSDAEGLSLCKQCPPGTYNSLWNRTSISDCVPCPAGSYSSTEGAFSEQHCVVCDEGHYCDTDGLTAPKKCPRGTYSSISGSSSRFDCIPCPIGTFSSIEGGASISFCQPCSYGRYGIKEGAIFQHDCELCPAGTYSEVVIGQNASVCIECSPGSYSGYPTDSCTLCPRGTYNSDRGSSSESACIRCPSPTSTVSLGSSSVDDCVQCEPGYYLSNAFTCFPCPKGTFYDIEALSSHPGRGVEICSICPAGSYQPLEAQVGRNSCIFCEAGLYSDSEGSSSCEPCGRGYYSTIVGSNSSTLCESCPLGWWSEPIISNSSSSCQACSPGTFSNRTGASSSSNCLLCPLGTKSEEAGSSSCSPCSFDDACFEVGTSFESTRKEKVSSSLQMFDPHGGLVIDNTTYLSLLFAVPCGFFVLSVCLFGCIVLILPIKRRSYLTMLRKVDFFFSMKHFVPKGASPVNEASVLGGVLSVLILIIFLSVFSFILIDFIMNNTVLLENMTLNNPTQVEGRFEFQTTILGKHKECSSEITLQGFSISESQWQCEQSLTPENMDACICTYECLSCKPSDTQSQVLFDFSNHMMSQLIMYSVKVPHFYKSQYYIVNGSTYAGNNSIFTGNDQPHTFSFLLGNTKYISISNLAPILGVFGIDIETESQGYSLQLSSNTPGHIQSSSSFILSKGIQVLFNFNQSYGSQVSKESTKRNVFTLMAEVTSLLSVLIAVGILILRSVEKLWKKMPTVHSPFLSSLEKEQDSKKQSVEEYDFTPVTSHTSEDELNAQLQEDGNELDEGLNELPRKISPAGFNFKRAFEIEQQMQQVEENNQDDLEFFMILPGERSSSASSVNE